MNDCFLVIDELAEKLKVKKSWIYARTRKTGPGAMPKLKVGKYIRLNYQDVLEWLRKNQGA
jgi:excisionase family DNA binding protein